MHKKGRSIHNLKKFFAIWGMKYTPAVYKDLFLNILLSKKEITPSFQKNSLRFGGGKKVMNGRIQELMAIARQRWVSAFLPFSVPVFCLRCRSWAAAGHCYSDYAWQVS